MFVLFIYRYYTIALVFLEIPEIVNSQTLFDLCSTLCDKDVGHRAIVIRCQNIDRRLQNRSTRLDQPHSEGQGHDQIANEQLPQNQSLQNWAKS